MWGVRAVGMVGRCGCCGVVGEVGCGGCDRCVSLGGVRGAGERKDVSGGGSGCGGGGVCGSRWCSRCWGKKGCER